VLPNLTFANQILSITFTNCIFVYYNIVDAYTTIARAIKYTRCYKQRSLLQNTLLPTKLHIKSSTSLPLKKKSNNQANLSLRRYSAPIKVTAKSIKSIKPIT